MKPESRFITSVNAKIPTDVHREKMHNPYRGGTFDVWYSGSKADLWIEYKFIPRIPKRGRVVPNLSPLQLRWGQGRNAEGRNVMVVVGCPEGAAMLGFPRQWEVGVTVEEFRNALVTKATLAAWIHSLTAGVAQDGGSKKAAKRGPRNGVTVQNIDRRAADLRAGEVQDVPKEVRGYWQHHN